MAAKLAVNLPEGPEWIYEALWDRYRAAGIKDGAQVRLLSRNEKNLAGDFPIVVEALGTINANSAIIDGEIISLAFCSRQSDVNHFSLSEHSAHRTGRTLASALKTLLKR